MICLYLKNYHTLVSSWNVSAYHAHTSAPSQDFVSERMFLNSRRSSSITPLFVSLCYACCRGVWQHVCLRMELPGDAEPAQWAVSGGGRTELAISMSFHGVPQWLLGDSIVDADLSLHQKMTTPYGMMHLVDSKNQLHPNLQGTYALSYLHRHHQHNHNVPYIFFFILIIDWHIFGLPHIVIFSVLLTVLTVLHRIASPWAYTKTMLIFISTRILEVSCYSCCMLLNHASYGLQLHIHWSADSLFSGKTWRHTCLNALIDRCSLI